MQKAPLDDVARRKLRRLRPIVAIMRGMAKACRHSQARSK
jgi:hypothetical protein